MCFVVRAVARLSFSLVIVVGLFGCESRSATAGPLHAAATESVAASPPVAATHSVFDLTDNRALAHLTRSGGLAVALGEPGLAKYLAFGRPWRTWRLNQRLDGQPVALAQKSVTWLDLPLTGRQAQATQLSLRLNTAVQQGLTITVNATKLKTITLHPGWQRLLLTLPKGTLKPGENRLALRWGRQGNLAGTRSYAAVSWLHIGQQPLSEQQRVSTLVDGKLALPAAGGVAYYLYPYRGAKLALRVRSHEGCRVFVRATVAGKTVLSHAVSVGAATLIDLAPISDRVSRLEIEAAAGCQGASIERAQLVMPGAAPRLRRATPPRNVLFWLIDNARADHYRSYNPKARAETPNIDALVKDGILFERALVQGTESRVSHASIWTGAYPAQHRFIRPKSILHSAWVTLPEAIKATGRYTAAWVANGFIREFWGFGDGWSAFRNTLHDGGGLTALRLADHAIGFIEKRGDQPFYLYVGTVDVHCSWRGREPWLKRYHPWPYAGRFTKNVMGPDVEKMATGKIKPSPADKRRVIAIYDSTISYNDHHLGRVVAALKKKGVLDQTMIVITADHGEEFWDYGRIGHGHTLRNPLVNVPLIISYPPLLGRGVRVREGVDVNAVMATVLDALNHEGALPPTVQAQSLLPLAQGVGRGYPRPSFASQYEYAHTLRIENYKLTVGGKGVPSVYDLNSAQREADDISLRKPEVTRLLTDALSTFLIYQSQWRQSRWGVANNHRAQFARDLEGGSAPPVVSPFHGR